MARATVGIPLAVFAVSNFVPLLPSVLRLHSEVTPLGIGQWEILVTPQQDPLLFSERSCCWQNRDR
jgi:hypothetical protein